MNMLRNNYETIFSSPVLFVDIEDTTTEDFDKTEGLGKLRTLYITPRGMYTQPYS